MNKNNLIFDWSDVETQRGWMGVSILIAVLGLVFFLSVIHVKFDFKKVASIKSASVFYLPDHEDGRSWLMKAQRAGFRCKERDTYLKFLNLQMKSRISKQLRLS